MKRALIYFTIVLFPITLFGQANQYDKDGVSRIQEDGLKIMFDNFTGVLAINPQESLWVKHTVNGQNMLFLPFVEAKLEKEGFLDWLLSDTAEWVLFYFYDGNINKVNENIFRVPFLIDDKRVTLNAYSEADSSLSSLGLPQQVLTFRPSEAEWNQIASAQDVRFRIAGIITQIPDSVLIQMNRISKKVNEFRADISEEKEIEETEVPPKTEEAEDVQEGVTESGDERGVEGDVNVDQGTGTTEDASSPYQIQWEGDLDRTPQVQPLPINPTNTEATVTIRFEVEPDGSISRVFPLRKMNPELERELMQTLRSWRFSRLPDGVPQEPQWGTITFRFVMD